MPHPHRGVEEGCGYSVTTYKCISAVYSPAKRQDMKQSKDGPNCSSIFSFVNGGPVSRGGQEIVNRHHHWHTWVCGTTRTGWDCTIAFTHPQATGLMFPFFVVVVLFIRQS